MFSSFDISTSGLVAQRTRLNAISSNLANMSTTRNELGQPIPYSPRYVTFQTDSDIHSPGGGAGVQVGSVEISTKPPQMKYQPGHPDADSRGYVAYPNVNMTTEMVDAMQATRAYEANVGVLEISKDMSRQTLRIIA
ncbi:flagellar basal body rod protein FlgC [Aeoliella sp. ICT_H6.2]|uniref:Flagellar basal-body rod protein FlgC n=1 Tax=Aeoliella straminimaris TaxID=2954799 RepID=A0A9X2FIN7_9BACT|nr:flagellar basal body rod protein FlgC [Aeoliella straminimaris]MCO6047361.1 flagellar basal body rod protein FlgC [Aeoliella straminimaris]